MNKIETEFDKLKRYEDIETYYPPLEDIKEFLYELFGDRVESQKYIVRANKQIQELNNNWNELEGWVKEQQEFLKETPTFMSDIYFEHKTMNNTYQNVLDKMKEIKENNG